MEAYAALGSLEHIINNLQLHSRPSISLHKEQTYALTQKVTFLQEFLQLYNPTLDYSKEADPLESRIARAAYAAEDAIESHILEQFTYNDGEKMNSDGLYEALEKVIEDMVLIEKEAMEIKETVGFQNQLHTKSTPPHPSKSTSSSSIAQKESSMVGADDMLLEMKSKLTADARDLQTLPIVGMGVSGISKEVDNILISIARPRQDILDTIVALPKIRKLSLIFDEQQGAIDDQIRNLKLLSLPKTGPDPAHGLKLLRNSRKGRN